MFAAKELMTRGEVSNFSMETRFVIMIFKSKNSNNYSIPEFFSENQEDIEKII